MSIKRITVIVPVECLEKLEGCLRSTGVHGMTVTEVQGFGEHANFFHRDLMVDNIRVDIYAGEEKAKTIVEAVTNFKSDDYSPAGILAVESVEQLVNLHNSENITAGNY